ncbi:MAG: hypothetical protein HN580_30100 [Deltaproteobacteria bacterium]|jgi:hypothetical protein|uniref:hypothetical protein n=1 Tax=Desulfobacula sp. TaxID=2593537 RepID=UPI001D2B50B9|nr:hypothetical protein [Deltaproteobacteria bacterium]MBT7632160.1 hypothetical protein [Desulfobacula sp.]MBT4088946.1 hypothetical protein [Deltaproteobacteria bacterium]MBT4267186.1 hypothetical protein [Deltaproteobacteria bacterium]MBT4642345.1 hypothetical protein [Deltaproteobacteria bacterium]
MPGRKYTEKQRIERSNAINEIKPWKYTTGPKSITGKGRSKMNAMTHGFNTKMLQDFRRLSRRKEVREFEDLCRELQKLAKNGNAEKMQLVSDKLEEKFQKLLEYYDKATLTPELQREALHTNMMMLKTMTFAIQKESMKMCDMVF